MRRWAVLVILLYFFILMGLTAPLILISFYPMSNSREALIPFFDWMYWALLGVMIGGQAVMLLVPVELAMGRPTTRRSVLWPVLASGLMMGLLGVGATVSIDEFVRQGNAVSNAALPLAIGIAVWALWSMAFYRAGRYAAPMDVIGKQCRYLLRGSILELLVAVPTHIVARARNYCCAGVYTFLGIAFGVSVMLFSFGPAVFFLFAQRWRRLHSQPAGGEAV